MGDDLKQRLKAALAGRSDLDIGQFKLLGLKDIREAAGDAWPAMKRKVFTAAGQLIERELDPRDVVLPAGDGFIVILADADADKAERLDRIGARLREFFLGSPEFKKLRVEAASGKAKAGDLVALAEAARPKSEAEPETAEPVRIRPQQTAPAKAEDGTMSPFFRPVWDAQKQQIFANACRPKVWVGGRPLDGRRVSETRMAPVCHAELDHLAQKAAFDALMRAIKSQAKTQYCLSIHAETWSRRDEREQILSRFANLPAALRKAFLVRFDGFGEDLPAAARALAELAASGVGLMAELPFGEEDLSDFDGVEVQMFGCRSKPPVNMNSEGMMDHDASALNRMVKAATERGATTYLQDVRDIYVLKTAMASGIRYFSGQAVIADRQKPAPQQPLSMVEIYRMQKAA